MRRILNAYCIAFCLVVIIVTVIMTFSGAEAQMQDITLATDFIINGTHAPYFVALDKGFYKDAGLKVEIVRGYGSGDTVKKVAAKHAAFGICDFGTLVTSVIREKTPVKALAAVYGKAMLGILYLEESGIKVPKDLEGRTLARLAHGASTNMLPAFVKANRIDRSRITEVVVDATAYLPMLLSRRVDAILEQSVHLGRFQKAADEEGLKVTVKSMLYADFGLESYGNVIFTHKDLIEKDPLLVKKFVQSSLKGLIYAFNHPEESASIVEKINAQVSKEKGIEELFAIKKTWTESIIKTGLGFMTPERTRISVDSITGTLGLEKPDSIDVFYNNKFVR